MIFSSLKTIPKSDPQSEPILNGSNYPGTTQMCQSLLYKEGVGFSKLSQFFRQTLGFLIGFVICFTSLLL